MIDSIKKIFNIVKTIIVNVVFWYIAITAPIWLITGTIYNVFYQTEISNKKTQMQSELFKYLDALNFSIVDSGEAATRALITKTMYVHFSAGNTPNSLVVEHVVNVLQSNGYKITAYKKSDSPSVDFESEQYLIYLYYREDKHIWQLSIKENTFLSRDNW